MPEILDPINLERLPQYTVLLMFGIIVSIGFLLWWMHGTTPAGRIIDICLAGSVLGVIVARAFHVALNWAYFSDNTAEITRLRAGGLDWHGAVIGALVGMWIMAKVRRVDFRALLVPLTLILPFMGLMGWRGCYEAFCSYGAEVDNLSNYPSWLVWEARDIYNMIAPRYRTQQIGMGLSVTLLALVAIYFAVRIYTHFHRNNISLSDLRMGDLLGRPLIVLYPALFWLILALFSAGMFFIGEMRGDFAEIMLGLRADQWLDVAFVVFALLMVGMNLLTRSSSIRPADNLTGA